MTSVLYSLALQDRRRLGQDFGAVMAAPSRVRSVLPDRPAELLVEPRGRHRQRQLRSSAGPVKRVVVVDLPVGRRVQRRLPAAEQLRELGVGDLAGGEPERPPRGKLCRPVAARLGGRLAADTQRPVPPSPSPARRTRRRDLHDGVGVRFRVRRPVVGEEIRASDRRSLPPTMATSTAKTTTSRRPLRPRRLPAGRRCGISTANGLIAGGLVLDWSGWVASGRTIGPGCDPGSSGVAPELIAGTTVVGECAGGRRRRDSSEM